MKSYITPNTEYTPISFGGVLCGSQTGKTLTTGSNPDKATTDAAPTF